MIIYEIFDAVFMLDRLSDLTKKFLLFGNGNEFFFNWRKRIFLNGGEKKTREIEFAYLFQVRKIIYEI